MKHKISVIVPVYNVEEYLDKCIESLIGQTYKNLEIILVDDGSEDKSGEICDSWKYKDSRIKVIHKKNGGLSDARNAGMDIATGDYIGFIDSDDYINKRMYEILLNNMNDYNSDISVCSIEKVYETNEIYNSVITNKNISIFTAEEALRDLIEEGILKQTVWNKLYKKSVIENIRFEFGKIHEDEFWSYQVFGKSSKIVYTDEKMYYYLQRAGSIMDKPFSVKRLDALEARYNRLNYIIQNYPNLELESKISLFFSCLYQYQCMLRSISINEKDDCKRIIKRYIDCISFRKDEIRKIGFKNKIWIRLSNISMQSVCIIRNFVKIGV